MKRYHDIKDPQVVRTEISSMEKRFVAGTGFSIDENKCLGLIGQTRDAEIRRQKWNIILSKRSHDDVYYITT